MFSSLLYSHTTSHPPLNFCFQLVRSHVQLMESEIDHLMQETFTKATYQEPTCTGHLFSLDSPAGWFVRFAAFIFELIISSFLSLIAPFICLLQESHAIPSILRRRLVSFLRRIVFGFVGALSAMAILVALMLVSFLIGVLIVRFWVDEPVKMEEVIYFDYTMKEPSAVVFLDGPRRSGVPTGHSVVVVLDLILPESEYNRQLGMFQVTAEAISHNGEIQAASSQPYMLRFRSLPIRLMHTFFMGLPILLGICTETQKLTIEILRYTEGRHRTNLISVKLKPRAGIADLPQLYTSEVKIRTQLPWMKQLVYNWKLTLYVWTAFYVYGFILILIAFYLKPSVFGLMSWMTSAKPSDAERERKKPMESERDGQEELTERLRNWRERMDKRRQRIEHRRVSESAEGCGSSMTGEEVSELIDDSGDFAASESSECI
ncbi:Seipin [Rhynchospora pubera]|uniref:Seipin n=1 Tax=Rhynchospora pubera TaxID=906938 RepID=A0AAV8FW53_9POAL|nr:Seipin [Rhynchospora pubera]